MAQERKINLDDIARGIELGVDTIDEQRAVALERLQTIRQVKATSLKREQARLALKYGDDHPRVEALTNRIAINEGFLVDVAAEAKRARTDVPVVNDNEWILHGYVRDENKKGVSGLTVALYDQSNEWVRELGYACTDQNGYFKLASTSSLINKGEQVRLRVLSNQSETLYADQKLLAPGPGQVDYREVVLKAGAQVCGPPVTGRTKPPATPATWVVRGRVTDAKGQGIGGLIVNVFDKDLIYDDRLGQTDTDASGAYSLTYRTEDFRDLIETKPDIYLKVTDQKGKLLYSTKEAIKYEVGRVEVINMEVGKTSKRKG
jgi:hypothetical protein